MALRALHEAAGSSDHSTAAAMAKATLGVLSTSTATVLGVISFREVGEVVIFIAATITAVGVIGRTRPAKWFGRVMIGDPAKRWIHGLVEAISKSVIEAVFQRYETRMKTKLDEFESRLRALESEA